MSGLAQPSSPKYGWSFDGARLDVVKARRSYPCEGARSDRRAVDCTRTIEPRDVYVAIVTDLFGTDDKCCLPCALASELVLPVDTVAAAVMLQRRAARAYAERDGSQMSAIRLSVGYERARDAYYRAFPNDVSRHGREVDAHSTGIRSHATVDKSLAKLGTSTYPGGNRTVDACRAVEYHLADHHPFARTPHRRSMPDLAELLAFHATLPHDPEVIALKGLPCPPAPSPR